MSSQQSYSIKQWSEEDKPREKLLTQGKETLTNSELLAIIIGSGNRNESAVALCKRMLASVDNNLNALGKLSIKQLQEFKGVGSAKAISIVAALELGRRRLLDDKLPSDKITSSQDVFTIMQPRLADLPHEEFWVLYLNKSNVVIAKQQLSKGGISGTVVDIRVVLKKALELNAVAIIVCHNHPSGNTKPSQADIQLTQKLKEATKTLDISLLDHIIITEHGYTSFADENIL